MVVMDKKIGKRKTVIYVVLAVSAVTFFITLPILCAVYGVGIWESFHDEGTVTGLVLGLVFGLVAGFVIWLVLGLIFGLGFGRLVPGFVAGLGSGLVFGLVAGLGSGLVFGFVAGLVASLVAGLGFGFGLGLSFGLVAGLGSGLGFGLVFGLVAGFVYFVSFLSIRKLLPLLKKLPEAIKQTIKGLIHPGQLKEYPIGTAITSFIIFYVSTIFFFSLWFYVIYLGDYSNFNINGNIGIVCLNAEGNEIRLLHWWHFLYFSVVTIATVGYGDISPVGIIPQVVVVIEILFGFGLVAFYLTTIFQILGRIEPKDESLQKQLEDRDRQVSELISEITKCNKQQDEIIKLIKQQEQKQRRSRATIMRRNWRRH